MRFMALAAAWLIAVGCSTVATKSPLGDPLAASEAKRLEGVWLNPRGETAWVKHVKDNRLRIAGVEWTDDHFSLVELNAYATEDEDRRYINFEPVKDADPEAPLSFVRIVLQEGDDLVVALPKAEAFDAAIKDGKLSGGTKQARFGLEVKLDSPTKALNEFVQPADEAAQFHLAEPMVLHRVQRFEEKVE